MNRLTDSEVHRLVIGYPGEATDITDELYRLGETMIRENEERGASLDAKATGIIGYASVISAFLLANAPDWANRFTPLQRFLVLLATVATLAAIAAAAFSVRSVRWRWFGEREWFKESAMKSGESLRRYHVVLMHRISQANCRINQSKALGVAIAQYAIAVAAVALGLTLLIDIAPKWFNGFF